jgi:nucleoside-diphosphate-sugar epimerase
MESSLENVLIIGGNGLLGSALLDLLLQGHGKPAHISIFDVKEIKATPTNVTFIKGDVRNIEEVIKACENIDTVFHVAAIVNFNPKNNAFMHAVNVTGTKNVLKACEHHSVKRLIYTSIMDVVYEGKAISNGDESLPYAVHHVDFYSHTKTEAEKFILSTPSTVAKCALRATGIYGPNDNVRFSVIVKAAKEGKFVRIGKNDQAIYSHVFSYNCAYAHLLAAQKLAKNTVLDGQAYFITDDSNDNFHRFVNKVLRAAGLPTTEKSLPVSMAYTLAFFSNLWLKMPWVSAKSSPLITKNAITSLTKDIWFNSNKAKRDFEYQPLYSLDEAIEKTAKWIKATYL